MKNLIKTQWVKNPMSSRQWGKAEIYKTRGGKLALRFFIGYGGELKPAWFSVWKPIYYTTVLGLYDALKANGLADAGIGVDDIKEVLSK